MSGHNKWSKIKHKKAASDAQKSKIFSKHAAVIAMEARKLAAMAILPEY
jgi:transcriptional/translational regulatory protein YebC/TACO1